MRIVFNLRNVSFGLNGGSLTLIKSANTLAELGNEVIVIDSGKNQCKWCKLKVEHSITKNFPKADVIIATGFKSYLPTINLPDKHGKKYVWIRGWETWNSNEKNIVKILSNPKINKLVNSIGLQNKLKQFNISSHIIFPGYDLDEINPLNIRSKNKRVILGGLYNTRHKTKRSDWIINIAKLLKNNYNIELWMFGNEKCNNNIVDKYSRQPNKKEKNKFYNKVDIWLSSSISEGLHIPPAEAMQSECCVVGIDSELNGTQDYLIDGVTGLVSKNNQQEFTEKIIEAIKNKKLREKLGKEGRKKILSIGSREYNMNKMVKLFEEYL